MSIVDKTAASQTETLTIEVDLPHPPAKVWRALTTPELLAEWLLPATGFDLTRGAAFTLKTQPFQGWDGTVSCRIVDSEEPRLLRYSWVVGEMSLDTIVSFTLTETESGTRLAITQSGFKPSQRQNFGGARYGWKMMSGKLGSLLEGLA